MNIEGLKEIVEKITEIRVKEENYDGEEIIFSLVLVNGHVFHGSFNYFMIPQNIVCVSSDIDEDSRYWFATEHIVSITEVDVYEFSLESEETDESSETPTADEDPVASE